MQLRARPLRAWIDFLRKRYADMVVLTASDEASWAIEKQRTPVLSDSPPAPEAKEGIAPPTP